MKFIFDCMLKTRENLVNLTSDYSLEEVNKIPGNFNNNLVWHIGHVTSTLHVLCYQLTGVESKIGADLIAAYRRGTKPEGFIDQQEFDEMKELVFSSAEDLRNDFEEKKFTTYQPLTTSYGITISNIEQAVEYIAMHDNIHFGYVMALRRSLK